MKFLIWPIIFQECLHPSHIGKKRRQVRQLFDAVVQLLALQRSNLLSLPQMRRERVEQRYSWFLKGVADPIHFFTFKQAFELRCDW